MKKTDKFLIPCLVLLAIGFISIKIVTTPPLLTSASLIEIPEGATTFEISKLLEEKRVIKKAKWFRYLTKKYKVQEKLKAGIYEFSGRTPIKKVISKLAKGEVSLVKVSIPEGSTIKEIATILEKKSLVKKEDFIQYANLKEIEGFLFPDTYFFPYKVSVEAISSTMFKRFKDVLEEVYGEPITEENFDKIKEIVTVASIVEKEAKTKNEREIVAGIIYNRLKKNMYIQSCSTVMYVLDNPKKRLSSKDIKIRSPYNTYRYKGLPPGPIANPGKISLTAAIKPKNTDYLFFVSMGDWRNYFSKTYRQHQAAIDSFLSSNSQTDTSNSQ
jgi:UPF0755 protein